MSDITNKEVGVRFTDDKYAKKEDVKAELNTTLIDPVWVKIYSYRTRFNKPIPLNNILKLNYFVCNTPAIVQKMNETNASLLRCLTVYNDMDASGQIRVKKINKQEIVRNVALYYGETITEAAINSVMNNGVNNIQSVSEAKKKASRYFLVHENNANISPMINQDYLTKLYVDLTGQEITTLYRNFNFENADQKVNNGVPFTYIERMMDNFFRFLQDTRTQTLVKASAAYFFINYVKPFAKMNEEIALLTFKAVLANDKLETISYVLPFELFLVKEKEFALEFKEVARGSDLTYALIKTIDVMNTVMKRFLHSCTEEHVTSLENDYRQEVVEETKPSDNQPNEPNNHEPITTPNAPHLTTSVAPTIAINKIEASLDEKDANKFERYLLEKDPRLKPKQAHFLARHCTLGSYYSIQMYKKKERVVYETARTSMDALTNLGYYRKEQIKNKFVYTPNKIEGK
ncbi:MAG: hypothetical protein MJ207_01940 [Bacilli bacterium]|nr:hypothetical protein [Bacilli bacterium]